jgi:hypothetical protein
MFEHLFSPSMEPSVLFEEVLCGLDELGSVEVDGLNEPALGDAVTGWCQSLSRLMAVGAPLLAAWDAQQAWTAEGAVSGTAWLRSFGELERPAKVLAVARRLSTCAPLTAAALATGELSYAKAAVLVGAITDGLEDAYTDCEDVLVAAAKDLPVRQVTTLARRWHATASDAVEGTDPTERLHDSRYLRFWETFEGQWAIEGLLDPDTGAALRAIVEARSQELFDRDRTVADTLHDSGLARTPAQRRADALAELVTAGADHHTDDEHVSLDTLLAAAIQRHRHLHPHHDAGWCLPGLHDDAELADAARALLARHGFDQPTITDTLTAAFASLHDGCLDDHDHRLDLTHINLLACDPVLSRTVLDAHGVPLDLGRSQRLANRDQRRALRKRDRGCAFPGCDRPPSWCDAHHILDWILGGPTNLDNLTSQEADPFGSSRTRSGGLPFIALE